MALRSTVKQPLVIVIDDDGDRVSSLRVKHHVIDLRDEKSVASPHTNFSDVAVVSDVKLANADNKKKKRKSANCARLSVEERAFLSVRYKSSNGIKISEKEEEDMVKRIKAASNAFGDFSNRICSEYMPHNEFDYSTITGWASIYHHESKGWHELNVGWKPRWELRDPTHKFRKLGKQWQELRSTFETLAEQNPYQAAVQFDLFEKIKAAEKRHKDYNALKRLKF